MIDRISFFLKGDYPNLADEFPGIEIKWQDGSRVGFLKQVQIRKYYDGLYISCSLPKLIYGENISVLPRKFVKEAVCKLEDLLDADLACVPLNSVEIGPSIIVKNRADRYIRLFGDHPRYPRKSFTNSNGYMSISYSKRKGSFSFQAYDKKAEMQAKEEELPLVFQGSNVLRLEMKIKRRKGIQARFEGKDLLPHDIYEFSIYEKLKRYFWKFYLDIQKTDQAVFFDKGEGNLTPKHFVELLAEQYYQSFPDDCRFFMAEQRAMGNIERNSYNRIKETLRPVDSVTGKKGSLNHELIEELNAKVWNWVKTG